MMITPLTLTIRSDARGRMWPDHGETLGGLFIKQATSIADGYANHNRQMDEYGARLMATLLTFAAEAYQHGADASIGHNRTARYEEQARECMARVERLAKEHNL